MKQAKIATTKISIIITWLLVFLNFINYAFAAKTEELKKGVVKIIVHAKNDKNETGAGIILDYRKGLVYIMTTYHIFKDYDKKDDKIEVIFYERSELKFRGILYDTIIDEDNDLAVIIVNNQKKHIRIKPTFKLGSAAKVKELDEITAIGHPSNHDWEPSPGKIKGIEPLRIRFESAAVDPGYSGGVLLNKKSQLIGMVTKKEQKYGYALKIDLALEIIKAWGIPYRFKRDCTIFWVGGILITGAIVSYYWDEIKEYFCSDKKLPDPPSAPPY